MLKPVPIWKSKTVMTAVAALGMLLAWRWSVFHLYSLPPEALAAFQAITIYCFSVFGLIICWGIGMKNVDRIFSLKTEAASLAHTAFQAATSKVDIREERIFRVEKLDPKDLDNLGDAELEEPAND